MLQSSVPESFIIGVDIGGTKIAAGLVDHAGQIRHQVRTPMVSADRAASGMTAVISAIDSISTKTSVGSRAHGAIRGVGICCPGPLDPRTGVVINPPNLPCWRNFPLAAEVSQIYRVPVRVDNDANAAALAEAFWGPVADTVMSSTPQSGLASEPASYSMDASTTDEPVLPPKAVT